MDLIQIKDEYTFEEHEQSSPTEYTSSISDTIVNTFSHISDLRSQIINGQIKLRQKRGRSKIWNSFATMFEANGDEIEGLLACRSCYKIFKSSSNTSNLSRHKCVAGHEDKEGKPKYCQGGKFDNEIRTKLIDSVTLWSITNCHYPNIIEDSGLKHMARIFLTIGATFGDQMNIDHMMPSPISLEKNITGLYECQRQNISDKLSKIKSYGYSLTCHLWSDNYLERTLLAITIHYIAETTLGNHVLAVAPLNTELKTVTGESIMEKFKECLQTFQCDLDIHKPIIVTSSDDHFKSAFQNHHQIQCINSFLNNIVERVFRDVIELRQLLDSCIKLLKNAQISGENISMQSSSSSSFIKSILYHFEAVHDNWCEVSSTLLNKTKISIEFAEIKAIVNILLSFKQTCHDLEDDNMPTMHTVIPHIHKLKKTCVNNNENIASIIILKDALKSHLDAIGDDHITKFHKIALFLFPPTKQLLLCDESERRAIIADCKGMIMQQCYIEVDSTNIKKIKRDVEFEKDSIFSDFLEPSSSNSKVDAIDREISEYLSRQISLSEKFDLLDWWKANKDIFPFLYNVSCKILGTPASTIASENAILQARKLLSTRQGRHPYADKLMNEIVFLNKNYNYEDEIASYLL